MAMWLTRKGIADKRAEQRIHDNFVKLVQYYHDESLVQCDI